MLATRADGSQTIEEVKGAAGMGNADKKAMLNSLRSQVGDAKITDYAMVLSQSENTPMFDNEQLSPPRLKITLHVVFQWGAPLTAYVYVFFCP